jgi:hypothetical protein
VQNAPMTPADGDERMKAMLALVEVGRKQDSRCWAEETLKLWRGLPAEGQDRLYQECEEWLSRL